MFQKFKEHHWACKVRPVNQVGRVALIFPMQRADNCQIIIKTMFLQWVLLCGTTFPHRPLLEHHLTTPKPIIRGCYSLKQCPCFSLSAEAGVSRNLFQDMLQTSSNSLAGFAAPSGSVVGSYTWCGNFLHKNPCGRCAWWRINLNNNTYRSTFQKGPMVFLLCCRKTHTSEAAGEHKLLHFIPCWGVKAWQPHLFIHPNSDVEMMTRLCGNSLVCVCKNRAVISWGFLLESRCEPHISGTGAGSREGRQRGTAENKGNKLCRKQSCGDVKCPACHQIPHLLAKLLQLGLLNVHRHKEKIQS